MAIIGTETSGLWPHKTGACLIEVHLHVLKRGESGERGGGERGERGRGRGERGRG